MIQIIFGILFLWHIPLTKKLNKGENKLLQDWFPLSIGSVAQEIDHLFWYSTAWTAGTGILVICILSFFLIRYRKSIHATAFYTHGNTKGALTLTLILAVTVFVALDVNLAYQDHKVWKSMFGNPPSAVEALKVEVMPEQFAWNIRYAGADATFGTADDIVTMNELHVPVGKPVLVQLTSKDVIHSFFLPNFRIKQDAIPGMVTSLYFRPDALGTYNIACAQHCGLGHYRMKGNVIIESQSEFDAWMTDQSKDMNPQLAWAWDWNHGLHESFGLTPKQGA